MTRWFCKSCVLYYITTNCIALRWAELKRRTRASIEWQEPAAAMQGKIIPPSNVFLSHQFLIHKISNGLHFRNVSTYKCCAAAQALQFQYHRHHHQQHAGLPPFTAWDWWTSCMDSKFYHGQWSVSSWRYPSRQNKLCKRPTTRPYESFRCASLWCQSRGLGS